MPTPRKDGCFELKYNVDKTQVTAMIHPAGAGGKEVTATEIKAKLKEMGVTYGVRDQAISDAIRKVTDLNKTTNAIVAQGIVVRDGKDAVVHYRLPYEVLSKPLPRSVDGHPDWFALDPSNRVQAGEELGYIVPVDPGTPGKTLTWPIETISPRPGNPASLSAGLNVRTAADGLRFFAEHDGYAYLHGDRLCIYTLRRIEEATIGGAHTFQNGAVFMADVQNAQIQAGDFVAIKGIARSCRIRANGDVFLNDVDSCVVLTTGDVYVSGILKDCEINTPKRLVGGPKSVLASGLLCATAGIEAAILGAPTVAATQLLVGVDRFSEVRSREIEEELAECEANIERISQALKPFAPSAIHTALTEDKRALLRKLQIQKQTQEMRIKALHSERRLLTIGAKDKRESTILATQVAYPGVRIGVGGAAMQLDAPMERVQFVEGAGGMSVQTKPLEQAA